MKYRSYPIKLFLKNPVIATCFLLSALINIFVWFWLFWQIGPQEEQIFLHYTMLFGVDLIGEWWRVLWLPVAGLFVFCMNLLLAWILFGKDKFAAYVFGFSCLLFHGGVLLVSLILVFLNI